MFTAPGTGWALLFVDGMSPFFEWERLRLDSNDRKREAGVSRVLASRSLPGINGSPENLYIPYGDTFSKRAISKVSHQVRNLPIISLLI